ncbi:hypothetical protein PENFLA_c001G07646 [Penicillium flavigenum]|uniref:3'-5' exonuclease domain-containing protein n=1 Tax=Penicillium flavigenum TaxID=254877 RepID=A0A1V6U2X0_9EURO|nr:hypothetical protein PENFLA_c001G07646 [Penicillium flavigenum]
MPMRPILLASRKTRSSLVKHSGHLNRSKSHGSLRWELWEPRGGPDTCARSVPRLRHVSLRNTSSSFIPLMTPQSKRNFSNTTRKEGIWDDDDEVPEPKPVQRIPGRPAFVRPAQHRDLGSLIRSRVDGKNRVSQRLRIEKKFNSLPSYQELVESFIQLKYKHVDDLLDESIKTSLAYEAEYGAISSILQKQINDVVSQIAKQVLHAEKTTQEYVTEWEFMSSFISARFVTMVSDTTRSVLQAEKITQKYVAEVTALSSSILGLDRIQAAVTKAENTGRMIDHDFCCIVFGRTPEWKRKLGISAQKIHGWQECLRTTQRKLIPHLLNISELSICQLRDTVNNDYLQPRNTARSRIDRVLHRSELIRKNYNELRLKSLNARAFPVRTLCLELLRNSNLRPSDRWVFGQYGEILWHNDREISRCAHRHRAFWLRRQMALHPLRQSELWILKDFMGAAVSARSPQATGRRVLLAIALGAPKASAAGQYLHKNPLVISNKIYLEYKRLWMPKPARSPELHIYWRQLDVMAPLQMMDFLMWRLQNEIWYLHHSLKGDLGALWAWAPEQTLSHTALKIADWGLEFQKHRSDLRQMISEYNHLNWLRLRSETLLHSTRQPVYLAGKFEVLNPLSQNIRGFKQWADRMGQIASDAHIISIANEQTRTDWESIHSEIEHKRGRVASVISHILELGSSAKKARRRRARGESESHNAKAAFIRLSQRRLSRYIKGQLSGHSESPLANRGNQDPAQVVVSTKSSLRRRSQRPKRAKRQHATELATNQGGQEESRLGHKLSPNPPTIKAEDHKIEGRPVSKPIPVDAPTGQKYQEDSQVIRKPSPKLWKSKSGNLDAPEFNPFLVNAPASQTNQEEKQVLPKPPLMPSKSKDLRLSPEPHLDNPCPPIPRGTSNTFLGARRHNGLQPATMLPRKPFAKPEPTDRRKYSTNAILYQTQQQSSGVRDDSLPERPLGTHMPSAPDTPSGHGPEYVEEDDSRDEPNPSSDIGSGANSLTTPRFWSHSSQQSPGGRKLIVHYCRSLQSTEEAVQHFLGSKVIGFDMEWKAQASSLDSIQNNVSVIQIANEERIALFQIALFKPARSLEDLVSPSLKRLVESPDVMKVGVSIKADCTRLRKYLGVDAKATFELSHLYKLVKYGKDNPNLVNKRGVNLSEQINEHFGLPLEKSDDVRCGDWTRALSYRQVQYAATDPYACVRLFHAMEAKRQAMDPMPPRPAYAELNQPIVLPLGQAVNSDEDPLI